MKGVNAKTIAFFCCILTEQAVKVAEKAAIKIKFFIPLQIK